MLNALGAAVGRCLLAVDAGSWGMPRQLSGFAADVDWIYWFIFWVSMVFFVLVVALMMFFVLRYRRRDEHDPIGVGATHNTALEITWTVIPLVLVVFMFFVGLKVYVAMATPPADSFTIDVRAQRWSWTFTYPGGIEDPDLHVWVGQPCRLRMVSDDVLHAFYAPVLRAKRDVVPGKTTYLWFEPTAPSPEEGYHIFCAEYCGTKHSSMWARLVIHENRQEFDAWLAKADTIPEELTSNVERGRWVYTRKGCNQCHSVDGSAGNGPTWLSLSQLLKDGKEQRFTDGTTRIVDEEYIRESIKKPQAHIVMGFQGVMPRKKLKEEEINFIIDFIRDLAESK